VYNGLTPVLSCQRFERPIGSFPCASLVLVGWRISLRRTGVKTQRPALEFALVLLPATGYAGARLSARFGSGPARLPLAFWWVSGHASALVE